MAAMHEEDRPNPVECANCGETEGLLKCSRCRAAWFCGARCQRAYWPFHRPECVRNEFADAVEEAEPRFAAWMRGHGKLAVLKDDEVDRLERAGAAASGARSRDDVMRSMYGRLDPSPAPPAWGAEEAIKVRARAEADAAAAAAAEAAGLDPAYAGVPVPEGLGADAGGYKWRQTQSHVEVFVPLPEGCRAAEVAVALAPARLRVEVRGRLVLGGPTWREVKADESAWYVCGRVLEVSLAKRSRRGRYADGETNADTFWRAVVAGGGGAAGALPAGPPPVAYYSAPCDGDGAAAERARRLPPKAAEPARRLAAAAAAGGGPEL